LSTLAVDNIEEEEEEDEEDEDEELDVDSDSPWFTVPVLG
jgi:hypothetical protein